MRIPAFSAGSIAIFTKSFFDKNPAAARNALSDGVRANSKRIIRPPCFTVNFFSMVSTIPAACFALPCFLSTCANRAQSVFLSRSWVFSHRSKNASAYNDGVYFILQCRHFFLHNVRRFLYESFVYLFRVHFHGLCDGFFHDRSRLPNQAVRLFLS